MLVVARSSGCSSSSSNSSSSVQNRGSALHVVNNRFLRSGRHRCRWVDSGFDAVTSVSSAPVLIARSTRKQLSSILGHLIGAFFVVAVSVPVDHSWPQLCCWPQLKVHYVETRGNAVHAVVHADGLHGRCRRSRHERFAAHCLRYDQKPDRSHRGK